MMKRITVLLVMLACIGTAALAQGSFVAFGTALNLAQDNINERLGTTYNWQNNEVAYQYEQLRAQGDNLGCQGVSATNQNTYDVTIVRFDVNLDGFFEWEYRYAYASNGTIFEVQCVIPTQVDLTPAGATRQPTLTPTNTVTNTPTPTQTPALEPIYGRDGARILPAMVCGGLKTRLVNGSTGRVIPGGLENNLRQQSDITSQKIGYLNPGEVFVVMDGPFCNGDIAWYLVGDGVRPLGWTAEGSNLDYFLEPVLTNALPIGTDNVAQLAPYGGAFAPGVQSVSANWPGGVLVSTGDSLQLWRTVGGFVPLESLQWEVATEFPTPHAWVFADNTGNQWGIDLIAGTGTVISPLTGTGFTAFTQPAGSAVAAIDNESMIAAVVNQDGATVSLVQLGRDGDANSVLLTLPHSGPVQDVAFSPNSMVLYVLTPGQLTVYMYQFGEGWQAQAHQVINTDISTGKLAVDEGGGRVAIAGTTATGTAALRLFNNLNTEMVGDETGVNYDAPAGAILSQPSFSADGTLLAAHANNGSVLLMDTFTGVVSALPVNNMQPTSGGLATFSRDGLVLWVGNGVNGLQAYAVRLPDPVDATTTFSPVVVTATPINEIPFIVVTATPTTELPVIIVTATDEPTLPPPGEG